MNRGGGRLFTTALGSGCLWRIRNGQRLFALTTSGVSVVQLSSVPLELEALRLTQVRWQAEQA
jgi:hypothetical protein